MKVKELFEKVKGKMLEEIDKVDTDWSDREELSQKTHLGELFEEDGRGPLLLVLEVLGVEVTDEEARQIFGGHPDL